MPSIEKTVTVSVDVDVDVTLDDFYDQDLLDEVEKRGLSPEKLNKLIREFYDRYRIGKTTESDLEEFLSKLFHTTLGSFI